MNKKLISLLLAICLVISLLPVMSIAETSEVPTATIGIMKGNSTSEITVTEGGPAYYLKSVRFDGYKTSSGTTVSGTGYKFTTEGASATDWNFKFEYEPGGVPTVTLKDAKLIELDAEGNQMHMAKEDGTGYELGTWSVVAPRNDAIDLKVVLQGDNEFRTAKSAILASSSSSNKFASVTVVGETDSTMLAVTKGKASIQSKHGVPVTIENATMNLTTTSTSSTASSSAEASAIYVKDAALKIKDTTLTATSTNTKGTAISAIYADGTGTISVENSDLELTATGTAFNKAPTLSAGWTAVAGESADSNAAVTTADALATAKYAKVTYPESTPDESTPDESTPDESTESTAPVASVVPAATTTQPTTPATPATSGSVTLWGDEVTVDTDDTTTDIPDALYWTNGAEGALPTAVKDTINWNYSFRIIDGIPTVTLKDASYSGDKNFLSAKYDGNLKLSYEGTNNIVAPYTSTRTARYFLSYSSATNSDGKGHLFLAGADDAVLNVTGGDNSKDMLIVDYKAHLTIYGGTINMTKTNESAYSVISAAQSKTTIQDCTLNIINNNATGDMYPAVVVGGAEADVTVTNAKVNIETNAHIGLCVGKFATTGVSQSADLIIEGSSDVKVVNTITPGTKTYSGIGIYAANVIVKSGDVEVEGNKQAVYGEVDLTNYSYKCDLFTEKGGAAVTEYTATTYLRIYHCRHNTKDNKPDSTTGEFVEYCTNCNYEFSRTPCTHEKSDTYVIDGIDFVYKCKHCSYEMERTTCTHANTVGPYLDGYDDVIKCNDCNNELSRVPCAHEDTTTTLVGTNYVTVCDHCTYEVSSVPCTHPNVGPVTEGGFKCADCGTAITYTLYIDGTKYELDKLDDPKYTVNTTKSGTFGEETKDYITQSSTGADASNYNAKLVWNTGDSCPTLYLKDFILDSYNEELSKWRKNISDAGIFTGSTVPLKIVIESGACVMQTYEGIHYRNDLTIESVGDASLTMYTNRTGIMPTSMGNGYALNGLLSGNKLTLNVNLNITQTSWATSGYGEVIRTVGADMIINGGNIVAKHEVVEKGARGIAVVGSGNLYVNGGYVYSETNNADNQTEAAIEVAGDIYITGGTVDVYSAKHSGLKATNINISGGTVKARVNDAPLIVTAETGEISFTGGLLDLLSSGTRPFAYLSGRNQVEKAPTLKEGGQLQGWVGKNPYVVEEYAGEYNKYNKLSYDPVEKNEMPTPVPGGEILIGYTLQVPGSGKTISLAQYDVPVYFKTVQTDAGQYSKAKDADGNALASEDIKYGPGYDVVEATEADWTGKLVWYSTDEGPTLYLNGFVYDDYWEEAPEGVSKHRYRNGTNDYMYSPALKTSDAAPLTVVLTGKDSSIQSYFGIHYANDLTIKSEDNVKLTVEAQCSGIAPLASTPSSGGQTPVSGIKLNLIDANLDVSFRSFYSGPQSKAVIYTQDADINIQGGNLKAYVNGTSGNITGIGIYGDTGNLSIKDANVEVESVIAYSAQNATVHTAGKITLQNSTVSVTANSNGVYGKGGVEIDGTTLKIRGGTSGIVTKTGEITFKSGLLDVHTSSKPFAKVTITETTDSDGNPTTKTEQSAIEPVLSGTLQGWVGDNPYVLTEFTGEYRKYIKLSYGPVEMNVMPTPVPGGDIPLKTTVTIGGTTYELKKYDDEVIYTVNKAVDAVDKDGNAFTRYVQTTEGANENNWNAKFIWHSTDSAPTLYLNGFVMDNWNNETSKFAWNASANGGKGQVYTVYPIVTGADVPLIIKLTGEDSMIESQFGIHFNNHLTILSDGDTKLTMNNQSSCVSSIYAAGFTLTVNANLDMSIRSLYNSTYSGGCLMNQGDIIVEGGTIVCDNEVTNGKDVNGIVARGNDGDLIINGGNITAVGSNAQGHRNAALQANGMLIINDGTVNASAKKAIGLNGQAGVEINGGVINVVAPWYGVTSGRSWRDENSKMQYELTPITINGGTMTIMAERAFFSGTEVNIGEGVMAYAGAGKKNAEVYDGTDTKLLSKPWFFSTDDETKFIEIEEDDEDDESILTPPTAPTTSDATTAPTDATGVPGASDATAATVPGDETPEDEIPEEEWYHSNIYVDYIEGDMDYIPDALYDIGLDSVDVIWETMLENMWWVDEYINRVSFFDAIPWYYDGTEWIIAEDYHLPEDGFITMMLPYPEGTDINTEFTALHMFTTDYFGMTPGEVELVYSENTEEGIYLELNGLSPVMLGWTDMNDTDDINPPTGDTDVAVFFTLMLVSVLGMAATVVYSKKRRAC